MSLQKVCFCMMKHDLLQRNRYAFRKRSDKGKEKKKVFTKTRHSSQRHITLRNTAHYRVTSCISDSSRLKSTNIRKALSTPQDIVV